MESGVINTKPRYKFLVVVKVLNVNLARVRMREGDIYVNTFLSKQFYSWNVLTEKNGGERQQTLLFNATLNVQVI